MCIKRDPGESFDDYKLRRKKEAKSVATKLNGTAIHVSSVMVSGADMLRHWLKRNPNASQEEVAEVKRQFPRNKFFKVSLQGTYKKEAGE